MTYKVLCTILCNKVLKNCFSIVPCSSNLIMTGSCHKPDKKGTVPLMKGAARREHNLNRTFCEASSLHSIPACDLGSNTGDASRNTAGLVSLLPALAEPAPHG